MKLGRKLQGNVGVGRKRVVMELVDRLMVVRMILRIPRQRLMLMSSMKTNQKQMDIKKTCSKSSGGKSEMLS